MVDDDIRVSMYSHAHEEATRYRDLEWQIAIWTLGLLGVVVAATQMKIPAPHLPIAKIMLSVFVVVAAIGGLVHIRFVRSQLRWNRGLMRAVEQALAPDPKFEAVAQMVKVKAAKKPPSLHLWTWRLLIVAAAVYAEYAVAIMGASQGH